MHWFSFLLLVVLALLASPVRAQPSIPELILATTTSTQDSGLLEVLVPMFEQQSGYRVKTISVGTGQAMALGARGEADVLLVHAPVSEKQWMAEGHGTDRTLVMFNDFVVIGPSDDLAGASAGTTIVEIMRRIAQVGAPFISRGDNSGTHQLELLLWRAAAIDPRGQPWYAEVGQGMGQTLTIANERLAYTITDRGTYLARQRTLDVTILAQGHQLLLNVYHLMTVNPDKGAHINHEGARAFAEFIVAPETQQVIGSFGVERFGQPLFFPAADRTEEELGA